MTIPFEKSFASNPKSKFWSNKNKFLPNEILNNKSHIKYWFYCVKCNHHFDISLNHVSEGKWCRYCNGNELCNNNDCKFCFDKSFASCEKSKYWLTELNLGLTPRQVCKNSGKHLWFKCEICNRDFEKYLPDVTGGHWCPLCLNKTEKKLFNILVTIYPTIIHGFKTEWCRRIRCLPFDFCIPELKIIIELDGRQHFEQVSNYSNPKDQFENDKYKEKCANDNGYSIIRLLQEDVWNDDNEWFILLQESIADVINNPTEIQNIYICNNNEYNNYL